MTVQIGKLERLVINEEEDAVFAILGWKASR